MAAKIPLMGEKYKAFLSEASNEEVVSISKELYNEMASQAQVLSRVSGLMVSAIAILMTVVMYLIIAGIGETTSYTNILTLIRIGAIGTFFVALMLAVSALRKMLKVLSHSPLIWRNVREPATDDNVFEHITTVNRLNKQLFIGRNDMSTSAIFMTISIAIVLVTYLTDVLVNLGYL